jgi:hypothetical protein
MNDSARLDTAELNCRLRNLKARTVPCHGRFDPETKNALTDAEALVLNEEWKRRTGTDHECVTRYILTAAPATPARTT